MEKTFVSVSEAADMLSMTKQGVYKAFYSGKIDGEKVGSYQLLYRKDVEKYKKSPRKLGRPPNK